MSESMERPEPRGWDKVAALLGGILMGQRKEDRQARTTAALLAIIGILGGVVVRGDSRTDRILEGLQESARAADKRTEKAIEAVAGLTNELRQFRESLTEPVPPKPFVPKPVRQTR